jgi:hypothetical protein
MKGRFVLKTDRTCQTAARADVRHAALRPDFPFRFGATSFATMR